VSSSGGAESVVVIDAWIDRMPEDEALTPRKCGLAESLCRRPPYPANAVGAEALDTYSCLRAYWNILRTRRWTIFTVTFVLAAVVAIYTFKVAPTYRATGRVEVEADTLPFQSLERDTSRLPADTAFLRTQVDVLTSNNLAWQTIQQLKLGANSQFNMPLRHSGRQVAESSGALQAQLIKAFHDRLRVDLAPDSRMLEVAFDSADPELAARAVNALMNNYIEYNFTTKFKATRQASEWMGHQLDELKAKVEQSQQALVDYERQYAIVNISDKENLVDQRLAALSQDLTSAQSDLAGKQSLFELVEANPSQIGLLAQDDLLQKLQEKFADLKSDYVNALAQYGPNFPKVQRIEEQVEAVQALINQERERAVDRIRKDYAAAVGREKILAREVAGEKIEVGNLSQLLIQHNILKRDFETNQDLYDGLLKRLKDATLTAGLRATNIHIVDDALVPTLPVRPRKTLNLAVGLLVGVILGVTLALVEEGLDTSIKNAEDAERLVPAPALAVVPADSSLKPPSSRSQRNGRKAARDQLVALAVSERPHSVLAESFRSLRTSILQSSTVSRPQVLLVTSTQPGEGKTSTAINLALALAQRGERVLLIDGDLRKPEISSTLGLTNTKGLSKVLAKACRLGEAIERPSLSPNLWALPAGKRPQNPAELLSAPNMEQLLQELRRHFDHLVIDSPPVLLVTDAAVLSKFVDGVLLVVESGVTSRNAVLRAYKTLETSGARILGTVVNKMDFGHDGYYGYIYKTYHHTYYQDGRPARAAAAHAPAGVSMGNSLPKS